MTTTNIAVADSPQVHSPQLQTKLTENVRVKLLCAFRHLFEEEKKWSTDGIPIAASALHELTTFITRGRSGEKKNGRAPAEPP